MRVRSSKERKLTCSKCNNIKEPNRHKYGYCLACHNENMRLKRPKHSELTELQRLKANCRSYLNQYLKRGKILKQPCIICNNPNSQAHHSDYTKPLEVIWYCRDHHIEHHKQHDLITN